MTLGVHVLVFALSCGWARASAVQEALLADTECPAGGGGDCSLSAVQLRARARGAGSGPATAIRPSASGRRSVWERGGVGSPLSLAATALARGQSSSRVTLYTQYWSWVPYVRAGVGNAWPPPWEGWLCLDSGSPLLWVRSVNLPGCRNVSALPGKSPSARALGRTAEFGYGGGVVKGPVYSDTLMLLGGPATEAFRGLTMLAATTEVGMNCADGILGMDMESTSAPEIFRDRGVPQVFTISLDPVPDRGDEMQEAGTMAFGSVDPAMYSGGLLCVPMLPMEERVTAPSTDLNPQGVPVNNTAWWQLEILGVRVGSREFGPAQGTVDTGTSDLIVTKAVMGHLDDLFFGLECDAVDSLPAIVFTLAGGHEVSVGPRQYVVQEGPGSCAGAVASLPDAPSPDFFVLGDPFFWKHFVAFDFAGKQVGLGLKAGMAGEPLPQTCPPALGL